ncbi:hypothetical protein [Singulisphaera acidiphila]|uniref:hypothetical protein n=2 Tax=Singulisphaera acidiphila TaxID=466153 RepID=UPI0012B50E15|nr:hypothetical protein [Singulisphaera acidiphila]
MASGRAPTRRAVAMLDQDGFHTQPWIRWRVKYGHKGPMVWEIKHLRFSPVGADGLPGEPLDLIAVHDFVNPTDLKFSVADAPEETSVQFLLLVSFSRRDVERCFQDQKSEIGLEQTKGVATRGLNPRPILSCLS